MAVLIDSYGKENQKDFQISSGYIRLNKIFEVLRNSIGVITDKYSVMSKKEIELSNSNQCEYIINGTPIWVTAKPLNKTPIKRRIINLILYLNGKKECVFYYKDYNFTMDKVNG